MRFILEYKSYFKEGDIVLIKYWYNKMITPVKIINKNGYSYEVSHDINESKIKNAPNEFIKRKHIISVYRG